jgi:DnaJ-class molecular chaperone
MNNGSLNGRGGLYIRLKINVPKKISEKEKELYQELSKF